MKRLYSRRSMSHTFALLPRVSPIWVLLIIAISEVAMRVLQTLHTPGKHVNFISGIEYRDTKVSESKQKSYWSVLRTQRHPSIKTSTKADLCPLSKHCEGYLQKFGKNWNKSKSVESCANKERCILSSKAHTENLNMLYHNTAITISPRQSLAPSRPSQNRHQNHPPKDQAISCLSTPNGTPEPRVHDTIDTPSSSRGPSVPA